jgi:2-dehydropantoate 2-reductase
MRKTKRLTPPPKKRKAEVWTLKDLESYRDHFAEEDMAILRPNSDPNTATPAIIAPMRRGRHPMPESGRKAKSDVPCASERPLNSIATNLIGEVGEVTFDERSSEVEDAGQDGTTLLVAGEANNQPDAKLGSAHVEEGVGPTQIVDPGPTKSDVFKETDILDEPYLMKEPHSFRIAHIRSESNPEPIAIPDNLEDPHDEYAAELSSRRDTDPVNLPPEYDEEMVRALQHFNLGAWDIPWRRWPSWPPTRTEDQLEKEPEKQLFKHLELQKEKLEFNQTIHILGLGTAGKYIAHSFASLPYGPPVTLLMHRPFIMQQWHDEGAAIRVLINGEFHVQTGFHIESSAKFQRQDPRERFPAFGPNLEHSAEPPSSVIDTLIVTTDAQTTIPALSSIRHRLRKSTTICFIQDGLGIIEKINKTIFPDSHERPTYILGRMSHNLASTDRHFTIVEKKIGEISCTKLPQVAETKDGYSSPKISQKDFSWSPQAKHLLRSLLRAPNLNTKSLGHKSFLVTQLEKLVVGAVIGPLSVAYDCSNDKLLYNYNVSQTMMFLLQEISHIIQSFPELATINNVPKLFNAERLEGIVVSCIRTTGKNLSPMLQEVRAGKKTDIDFYNGYLIMRAKELGISCPHNDMLLHLVKGKQAIKSREKNLYIPFRDEH